MIIHGASVSPFVRKAAAFAKEKGLDVELRAAMPGSPDAEFRKMSPFGKIPAFSDGDFCMSDSSAIVHYLEAKHPAPALIPTEAKARGRTVWFDEIADTILVVALGKIFWNRVAAPLFGAPQDLDLADKAEAEEVPPIFAWLESALPDSGHLVEDRLTLADIAVASPLANGHYAGVTIDPGQYPRLAAFRDAMFARPSFKDLLAMDAAMLGR